MLAKLNIRAEVIAAVKSHKTELDNLKLTLTSSANIRTESVLPTKLEVNSVYSSVIT
ncbi:hypothetical protein Ciccas_009673 [Cichlidogyrus casuarinus]|uniref:Uncharacterized protein n=1 Tax=Cichlidogyrus casuarinus TaxID=1844966 RepID=A0ABD2PWC6_9PLAT